MGIKTIVNSDGLRVHVGNTVDTKFQSILAQSGNIAVDANYKFEKGKWDGSKWVEILPTDMEKWVEDMENTDREHSFPRFLEDLITDNPDFNIHEKMKTRYDEKVALRATQPKE
jgi:hypothetical protein